ALGLATFDARRTPMFLAVPALAQPRDYSERTAETIDAEVRRILDESRERVTKTLIAQRAALDRLAHVLLEQEVVDRAMLDRLMAEAVASPAEPNAAAAAGREPENVSP
ncbi:MAG: cell division protein FtsH, partial [Rubrivivax sp.]|nr:cell division protein FtsH [Rubrivivax sp.]